MPKTLLRWLALSMFVAQAAAASAQDLAAFSGDWRGQVQWYATVDAKPDTQGHSVGILVLSIDPRGKLVVSASDMGCTGLGLFSAGPMPSIKTVDITFSGCSYAGYNRRFGGTMLLQEQGRRLKIRFSAQNIGLGRKTAFFELKGALSR
jgi:hypothetical protein